MTIKAILGMQHLPSGNSQGAYTSGFGLGFSGLPLANAFTLANYHFVDSEKWMAFSPSGASNRAIGIALGAVFANAAYRKVMGFRYKLPDSDIGATSAEIVGIASTPGGSAVPGIFFTTDLPDRVPNKEYFLEFELVDDGVNTPVVFNRWIDGKPLTPVNYSAGTAIAGMRNGTYVVRWTSWVAAGKFARFKDFYWAEGGVNDTVRLGPIRLEPIVLDTAVGTDWSASNGGVIKDVIGAKFPDTGDTATPYAQNSVNETPLTVNLGCAIPDDAVVKGVQMFYSSRSTEGTSVRINTKLKYNGSEVTLNNDQASSTMVYGKLLPIQETAPGAVPWSKAILDQTDIVLTPTTGV